MIKQNQSGASLIEVLVAMLLLSLTLLIVAGLHARALQFNTSASLNSQMSIKAADLFDRMRLNREALTGYTLPLQSVSAALAPQTNNLAQGQMRHQDLARWLDEIADLSPSAQVRVGCNTEYRCEIEIHWEYQIGKDALAAADRFNRIMLHTKI